MRHTNPVPARALYPYSALAFPLAAAFIVIQVLLPTYYAETTGLSMTAIGLCLLLARLFDMVSDPVVGWLSDSTKLERGKRAVWIALAAPFLAYACWKLFNPVDSSTILYLLTWSVAVYAFGTMTIVPLNAWGAELSPDYNERSRVTGVRAGFGLIGTLCALLIPALLLSENENDLGASLDVITWMVIISLGISVILAVALVPDRSKSKLPKNSITELVQLLRSKNPLRQLLISFLFNGVGNAIPATLFLFYVSHVLEAPGKAGQLLFLYFICATCSIPIWIRLSSRFEKHHLWIAAIVLASLFFVWTPILGSGDLVYFAIIVAVTGFAAGADLTIPTSINGDLIEWDMLNTGHRRPGLFFALWGTTTKLAFALAIGIAFPILEFAGFDASSDNTDNAKLALALAYGLPCIGFKLFAGYLMRNYPITRAQHASIREKIEHQN